MSYSGSAISKKCFKVSVRKKLSLNASRVEGNTKGEIKQNQRLLREIFKDSACLIARENHITSYRWRSRVSSPLAIFRSLILLIGRFCSFHCLLEKVNLTVF